MIKLYKKIDGRVVAYHEAWTSNGMLVTHRGRLGERGETLEHPLAGDLSPQMQVAAALADAANNGYESIDFEEQAILLVEYAIDGMGTVDELNKRHELQDLTNDCLGWTGLGHCDGGSTGSNTMEVCCIVVDFEIAKRVIEERLRGTKFSDYSRIYSESDTE